MIVRRAELPVVGVCLLLTVAGCSVVGSPSSRPPQSHVATSPVVVVDRLNAAIQAGHEARASSYFTPHLRSVAGTTPPSAMLGITTAPAGYTVKSTAHTASAAKVTVIFHFLRGKLSKSLALIKFHGRWKINSITPK